MHGHVARRCIVYFSSVQYIGGVAKGGGEGGPER